MEDKQKTAKLFVGNLTYKVTQEDLNNVFRAYGEMQDIKIIDKGRHVYAFVEFTNIGDAEEAYRELQGKEVRGTNLKIEYASGPRNKRDGEGREGGDRREGRDGGRDSGRERGGRSSGDGKDRQECYQCGSTRHFKRDCPELNKSRSRSRDKLKRDKKKKSHRKRSTSSSRSASSSAKDKKQKKSKKHARSGSASKSNS